MTTTLLLSPLEIRNAARSILTIATALNNPAIFKLRTLTDAMLAHEMKKLGDRLSRSIQAKRPRKISFTVTEITALTLIEQLPIYYRLDDSLLLPLEILQHELIKRFIEYRSFHNQKPQRKQYEQGHVN